MHFPVDPTPPTVRLVPLGKSAPSFSRSLCSPVTLALARPPTASERNFDKFSLGTLLLGGGGPNALRTTRARNESGNRCSFGGIALAAASREEGRLERETAIKGMKVERRDGTLTLWRSCSLSALLKWPVERTPPSARPGLPSPTLSPASTPSTSTPRFTATDSSTYVRLSSSGIELLEGKGECRGRHADCYVETSSARLSPSRPSRSSHARRWERRRSSSTST